MRSPWLVLILRNINGTGFSNTDTLILFQTSEVVGSWAIFSAMFISSGRTEAKTVYSFFHSSWFARLMKNSGPEPIHATEPLLKVGQTSVGNFLNVAPWASNVPWTSAKGGPKGAWEIHRRMLVIGNTSVHKSGCDSRYIHQINWNRIEAVIEFSYVINTLI